jgi:hypothetical protein
MVLLGLMPFFCCNGQNAARGRSYVVDRTFTTAKLMQGEAVLCSGTTPVNKHIPALLGFGLDVFDVACAANQGDMNEEFLVGRFPSHKSPNGV